MHECNMKKSYIYSSSLVVKYLAKCQQIWWEVAGKNFKTWFKDK